MPIEVLGSDHTARDFYDNSRTLIVSRHGAKILLTRKLVPDQEITIRCLETGKEGVCRVVGHITEEAEGYTYGVSFLDAEVNPWGIEFPPSSEAEKALGRVVLECSRCHTRELAYLDGYELEVLQARQSLSRRCRRCNDASIWKKPFAQELAPEGSPPPPVREEDREKRSAPRTDLKVMACVRYLDVEQMEMVEEIVTTRNLSSNGLSFESRKQYAEAAKIEVAVPFTPGGGNIFIPSRIFYVQHPPDSEVTLYGVAYIRR
jgi:hypothetical protein